MHSCCAYRCKAKQDTTQQDLSFHKFPTDEKLKEAWIKAIPRSNSKPIKNLFICSRHFRKEDYVSQSPFKQILKKEAIPSIFHHFPSNVVLPKLQTERRLIVNEPFFNENLSSDLPKNNINTMAHPTETNHNASTEVKNERSMNNKAIKSTTNNQERSTFAIVSDLISEVNSIKKRMDLQLKRKRTKNCRLKAKIEKLTKSLDELKEDYFEDNPTLSNLCQNAIRVSVATFTEESNIEVTLNEENISISSKPEDKYTAFGIYLANELRKIPYEESSALKDEIRLLVGVNKLDKR